MLAIRFSPRAMAALLASSCSTVWLACLVPLSRRGVGAGWWICSSAAGQENVQPLLDH